MYKAIDSISQCTHIIAVAQHLSAQMPTSEKYAKQVLNFTKSM